MKQIKPGDLTPTRDLNYARDTCRGFLAIAESVETMGKEIIIATNNKISMADTLKLIKKIIQSDVEFITDGQRRRRSNSEVFRLRGDSSLITSLTD